MHLNTNSLVDTLGLHTVVGYAVGFTTQGFGLTLARGTMPGVIRVRSTRYAIIVAPKSTQTTGIAFKTSNSATANTRSVNDVCANTCSMANWLHSIVVI